MMSQKDNHIDRLFSSHLRNLREKPPAGAWNRLDHSLGMQSRARKMLLFRRIAAIALILIAFGAGYFFGWYNGDDNTGEIVTVNNDTIDNLVDNQSAVANGADFFVPDSLPGEKTEFAGANEPLDTEKNRITDKTEQTYITETRPADVEQATYANRSANPLAKLEVLKPEQLSSGLIYLPGNINPRYSEPVILSWPEEKDVISYTDYPGVKDGSGSKWSLGANASPLYSYRVIGSSDAANSGTKDLYNQNEQGILAFTGGVNVNYEILPKLALESGLYYSRIGQENNNPLVYSQDGDSWYLSAISSSAGNFSSDIENLPREIIKIQSEKDSVGFQESIDASLVQRFEYFEVPFFMKYRITGGKLGVNVAGGFIPALLVGSTNYLEVSGVRNEVDSPSGLRDILYNGAVSVGMEYRLMESLKFSLQPTFKYSFSSLLKGAETSYNAYSIGWLTGLRYDF
ncbi:MAG: outer membrane beta-barrel protein [Bacteroidales bacterium]|nr:outer membrane beta-barrel protein [Bacteroidales bacterium]